MDEDQIGSARNKLRLAAGLVVFGVGMGLRHYFLVDRGPQADGVPMWFWLTLVLSAGMLVGAVEFESGLLEVYGLLIGAACSVLGALIYGPFIVYMFFAFKLWEDAERSFVALVGRGPLLTFAGFLLGAALTGRIVWSFAQDLLENQRASGRTSDGEED